MNEHRPIGQPRDVAAWLGEGPEHAPSDLLARSMASVALTRQRRRLVALALGAPDIRGGEGWRHSARLWVAFALLVLAAIVAIAVAGAIRQRPLITSLLTPSPPATVPDDTPIPSEPLPTEHLPFDAGQNVSVAWSDNNPWSRVEARPGGNPTLLGDHLREVVFESCIDGCTGRFVIDFTVGTIEEGIVYGWQDCPIPGDALACAIYQAEGGATIILAVEGTTTDELAAAWQERFGPASGQQAMVVDDIAWQVLTYADHAVGIVAQGSRVVAVTVRAQGGLPADAVLIMLERFLPAIQFGAEPNPGLLEPIHAALGDITITMPANFGFIRGGPSVRIREDADAFSFFIEDQVTSLAPGAVMRIDRYGGSDASWFEVTGTTLAEVRDSITNGLGDATPTKLRIGDATGYRWGVSQASIVRPLVAVAVIKWKGTFYVFEEHVPLDGSGQGNFDLVLQGVTLQ